MKAMTKRPEHGGRGTCRSLRAGTYHLGGIRLANGPVTGDTWHA